MQQQGREEEKAQSRPDRLPLRTTGMAWKGTTPNAAAAAAGQRAERPRKKLPARGRKNGDSLFLDARLPAYEQAKNILFKYNTDGDIHYNAASAYSEESKKQPIARAATDVRPTTSSTTKSTSSTVCSSRSTVECLCEADKRRVSQLKREWEGIETFKEQATQRGPLTRSSSCSTQSGSNNSSISTQRSNSGSSGNLSKNSSLNVRQKLSGSRTGTTGEWSVAGTSSRVSSSRGSCQGGVCHVSNTGNITAALERNKNGESLSSSADGSEQKPGVDTLDGDAAQHSDVTSQAGSSVSSATTVTNTGGKAYTDSLKAAIATFLSLQKHHQQQDPEEHEEKGTQQSAHPQQAEDPDEEVGAALFNDDAAWERLITDLREFQVK